MSVDHDHDLSGGGGGGLVHAMHNLVVVVALTAIVDPRPPVEALRLLSCRSTDDEGAVEAGDSLIGGVHDRWGSCNPCRPLVAVAKERLLPPV